jgi:cytochrome P450
LSYVSEQAMRDIYLPHKGREAFKKELSAVPGMASTFIFQPSSEVHAHMRKRLNPGFSDKAIRDRESTIQAYTGLLIRILNEK